MAPDELYESMLADTRTELAHLSPKQVLLFGFVAAMRQLPAYFTFCEQYPEFGSAETANHLIKEFQEMILGGSEAPALSELINRFDNNFIPDTGEFDDVSVAMEGALALVFLFKYNQTGNSKKILEIFRGINECILMSENVNEVICLLFNEQRVRRIQFELINSSRHVTEDILNRCLAMNTNSMHKKTPDITS